MAADPTDNSQPKCTCSQVKSIPERGFDKDDLPKPQTTFPLAIPGTTSEAFKTEMGNFQPSKDTVTNTLRASSLSSRLDSLPAVPPVVDLKEQVTTAGSNVAQQQFFSTQLSTASSQSSLAAGHAAALSAFMSTSTPGVGSQTMTNSSDLASQSSALAQLNDVHNSLKNIDTEQYKAVGKEQIATQTADTRAQITANLEQANQLSTSICAINPNELRNESLTQGANGLSQTQEKLADVQKCSSDLANSLNTAKQDATNQLRSLNDQTKAVLISANAQYDALKETTKNYAGTATDGFPSVSMTQDQFATVAASFKAQAGSFKGLPGNDPLPPLPAFSMPNIGTGNSNQDSASQISVPPTPTFPTLPSIGSLTDFPLPPLPQTPEMPAIPAFKGCPALPAVPSVTLDPAVVQSLQSQQQQPQDTFQNVNSFMPDQLEPKDVQAYFTEMGIQAGSQAFTQTADGKFATPALPARPAIPAFPELPAIPATIGLEPLAGTMISNNPDMQTNFDNLPFSQAGFTAAIWTQIQTKAAAYQRFALVYQMAQSSYSMAAMKIVDYQQQLEQQAASAGTTVQAVLSTRQATTDKAKQVAETGKESTPSQASNFDQRVTKLKEGAAFSTTQCTQTCDKAHLKKLVPSADNPNEQKIATFFQNPNILTPQTNVIEVTSPGSKAFVAAHVANLHHDIQNSGGTTTALSGADLERAARSPNDMAKLSDRLQGTSFVSVSGADQLSPGAATVLARVDKLGVPMIVQTSSVAGLSTDPSVTSDLSRKLAPAGPALNINTPQENRQALSSFTEKVSAFKQKQTEVEKPSQAARGVFAMFKRG